MLTLKWIVGLVCLLYPERAEAVADEAISKDAVHADQMTCGTSQALIKEHAT